MEIWRQGRRENRRGRDTVQEWVGAASFRTEQPTRQYHAACLEAGRPWGWTKCLLRKGLLEKEMATHSSILAWKIPWTEEPGRLQSMGSQRVGHD